MSDHNYQAGSSESDDRSQSPSTSETSFNESLKNSGHSTSSSGRKASSEHSVDSQHDNDELPIPARRSLEQTRSIPLPDRQHSTVETIDVEDKRLRSISTGSLGENRLITVHRSSSNILRTNDNLILLDKAELKLTPTQQLIRQLSRSNSMAAQRTHQTNQVGNTIFTKKIIFHTF